MKASVESMPLESRRSDKGLVTSHFRNEIGNQIHIRVEETQDTGTNAKTKKRSTFDAVHIVIEGPTSTSENTLTRQEAAELLRCLQQIF
jgi:hypothetical protein